MSKKGYQISDLTDDQIRNYYEMIDSNGNGGLDLQELKRLLELLDAPLAYAQLCFRMVCEPGEDEINLDQFKIFISHLKDYFSENKTKFYNDVFDAFDDDGSGTLEVNEVQELLTDLEFKCTKHMAAQILKVADDNSDMRLNRKEFIRLAEGLDAILED